MKFKFTYICSFSVPFLQKINDGEIFPSSDISAKHVAPWVLLFNLQKKARYSQAIYNFIWLSLFFIIAKNIKKFISIVQEITFKLFVSI